MQERERTQLIMEKLYEAHGGKEKYIEHLKLLAITADQEAPAADPIATLRDCVREGDYASERVFQDIGDLTETEDVRHEGLWFAREALTASLWDRDSLYFEMCAYESALQKVGADVMLASGFDPEDGKRAMRIRKAASSELDGALAWLESRPKSRESWELVDALLKAAR